MSDRVYAIHTDEECERLEAQALLAGVSNHVAHIPAQPDTRILDAGCGSGSMAREIAKAAPGSIVVGIDLRDKYVDYARRRAEAEGLRNLTLKRVTSENCPLRTARSTSFGRSTFCNGSPIRCALCTSLHAY